MLSYIFLLCCFVGFMELVHSSQHRHGYNAGGSPLHASLEVHGISRYPHGSPSQEAEAVVAERQLHGPSAINPYPGGSDDSEAGRPNQRRGNWCSFVHSRIVTFVASCKTEKYVIKSQQSCPHGTPECQKTMYRVALKPVYQVKQKVLTSVEWKCCPGHTGTNCEHNDPNSIPIPAIPITGVKGASEIPFPDGAAPREESAELLQTAKDQQSTLVDLQNDVHQATSNLMDVRSILETNITGRSEINQTNSEFQERLLQQVLLPYVENFLREHFNPVWISFNKSLQNLSSRVQNLSENVEINRKNIDKFQASAAPKKDLQELGSKFESKIQENVGQLDQLRQDVDTRHHTQQAGLHYDLTMAKTETDLKLKRYHKIQQTQFSFLNTSIEDMRRGQENLQDEIQALNRNITELWLYCGPKERESTQLNISHLNETLKEHVQKIKDLDDESEAAFQNINTLEIWVKDLRTQFKHTEKELKVSLIEKGLIMEENKEALQRQLMELNYTIINLQESHEDLLLNIKNCDCQKLTADLETLEEDQRNLTSLLEDVLFNLSQLKQKKINSHNALQNSVEDLSMALHPIQDAVESQQKERRNITESVARLSSQVKVVLEDVSLLRKADQAIDGHLRNLDSLFNSLLEDASRHSRALEALLGEEIMEVFSEEEPEVLKMSIFQVLGVLNGTAKELEKQHSSIESLRKRVQVLEMQSETQSDSPEPYMPSDFGRPTKSTTEEFNSKHSILEHMEPNQEAAGDEHLDNPAYNDILTLKKDVKHLSMEMKKLDSHWTEDRFLCNESLMHLMRPLNISVDALKADTLSLKQLFGEHLNLFKNIFKNSQELAASNTSLDLAKIHSVMTRKIQRQQRMEEQHRTRDPKPTKVQKQTMPVFTENSLNPKLLEGGSSVAFYAGFSEGDNETRTLHFNELYLNYGNGYVLEDGHFKAPHQGVYVFIISVEFGPGPAMGQLIFGNQGKIPLRKRKGKVSDGRSMTRFAVVELKKGESVWFELVQGSVVKQSPPGTLMGGYLIFKT